MIQLEENPPCVVNGNLGTCSLLCDGYPASVLVHALRPIVESAKAAGVKTVEIVMSHSDSEPNLQPTLEVQPEEGALSAVSAADLCLRLHPQSNIKQ